MKELFVTIVVRAFWGLVASGLFGVWMNSVIAGLFFFAFLNVWTLVRKSR